MIPYKQFDHFAADSALDFSWLNHCPAGKYGFVRSTPDGHFAFENGERVKFFGINLAFTAALCDKETAEKTAEDLYRAGINIARIHHVDGNFNPSLLIYDGDSQRIDEESFDKLDYLAYQLKLRGIYLHIDLCTRRTYLEGDGFSKEEVKQLVHFIKSVQHYEERIIALQKLFIRQYLHHRNPYTGLRYVDDPAVAIVQYINENSIFGDNPPTRPPIFAKQLDDRFNAWLLEKYGSREALDEAWTRLDGAKALRDEEDPENGTVARPELGNWVEPMLEYGASYEGLESPARHADHVAFLAELQEKNVAQAMTYFDELGVKCVRNYSNLPAGAADLRMNSGADATENNAYWNHPEGGFIPPVQIHSLEFNKLRPDKLPHGFLRHSLGGLCNGRVSGKPFITTEWCCCITPYRADALLQMAAYGAFQDMDGFLLYAYHRPDGEDSPMFSFFDVRGDAATWSFYGMAAAIFRGAYVQRAQNHAEIRFTEADWLSVPKDYGMLTQNLAYVSKVSSRFVEDGANEPAVEEPDLVISSGHTASGDYRNTRHAIVHSVSPYSDPFHKNQGREAWLKLHRGSGSESLKLGWTRMSMGHRVCVVSTPDGRGLLGHKGHRILQEAMTRWKLLSDKRGYLAGGVVISDTGELRLEYRKGIYKLDTPGVAIAGGNFRDILFAGGIRFTVRNRQSMVCAFSLDKKPLAVSSHILISAMGRCQNSGLMIEDDMLLDYGHGPLLYEGVCGYVHFPAAKTSCKVYALDNDGARGQELAPIVSSGGFLLELDGEHVHYEIVAERQV